MLPGELLMDFFYIVIMVITVITVITAATVMAFIYPCENIDQRTGQKLKLEEKLRSNDWSQQLHLVTVRQEVRGSSCIGTLVI